MNKYYVYSVKYDVISRPMTFKEAKLKQDWCSSEGDELQILKIVVDCDGKVVK